jgi:hypothetical protein
MAMSATGSNKMNKLVATLGFWPASSASTKDIGEAGIFFKVFPNNHPEANIAGIEIKIP